MKKYSRNFQMPSRREVTISMICGTIITTVSMLFVQYTGFKEKIDCLTSFYIKKLLLQTQEF